MNALDKYSLDAAVLEALQTYKSMSRTGLRLVVGGPDREIRRSIERLRDLHYPIGLRPGGGYSYGDREDTKRAAAFYRKKALKELRTASCLDGVELEGQMTMKEVFGDEMV